MHYSWVLTAGHCFPSEQKTKEYFVVAGMDNIENLDKRTVQISKIASYKVYPMYAKMNHKHDIAVARVTFFNLSYGFVKFHLFYTKTYIVVRKNNGRNKVCKIC